MTLCIRIEERSQALDVSAFDNQFATLPEFLFKSESRLLVPSKADVWKRLLMLAQHRKSQFWLAFEENDNAPLARIGADIPKQRRGEGSIGFFECADSPEGHAAGVQLLGRASEWLASNGVQTVFAPMDYNSWFNYRFKIRKENSTATDDRPWEPAAPDFHRQLFAQAGFEDHLHFSSLSYEIASPEHWHAYLAVLKPDHENVTAKSGYRLRPLAGGSELMNDVRQIFELSLLAFADNPMFEEIPFEIFAAGTLPLLQSSNTVASRICLSPTNQTVGFAFCFEEKGELIYKSVAVHPQHRALGIANALTFEISSYCLEKGITKTTGALIRSGNSSEKIGRKHGQFAKPSVVREYVLMQKDIR